MHGHRRCSQFLAAPFVASLILTGIHAYLGVHVVERGVIFVDLSLAQIAALGATIALLMPFSGGDPHAPVVYWISLGVHLHRRGRVLDDPQPARAHPAGGDHRHLLRGGVGGGDPGDEQGDLGERAPEGHAGRQHPRGVVGRGRQDRAALRRGRRCSTTSSASSSSPISMDPRAAPRREGISIRLWDFLFYASFGFVVTSSVAIAGVLLVFCYLIVPSVAAMLYAERSASGSRSAGRWARSCRRSASTCRCKLDLPTGATIVCTFGLVLIIMAPCAR